MSFLSCKPSVFVIGNEYEILLNAAKNGIFSVSVGDEVFYEENSGVLSSEKNFAKIRVPQSILDEAKKYRVTYRKAINRKAYFSEMGEALFEDFAFKPITKTDNINIYHVADVHYRFASGVNAASFFGDELDALVVNGDIGEVETEKNYFEVCKFVGDITGGEIPVVFVRGNHDTRGKLAERFTDYFPANGKQTYFDFKLGCLRGIALDCGEDKLDFHKEYNGVNVFEGFRRRETEFLRSLNGKNGYTFAVSHICPAQTTPNGDVRFDIERDTYTEWNKELARLGVKFMLCGHIHKAYVLERNDPKSILPHEYAVIVGSEPDRETNGLIGAALTVTGSELTVKFTNEKKEVVSSFVLDLEAGMKK